MSGTTAEHSAQESSSSEALYFWKPDSRLGGFLSQWTSSAFSDGRHEFSNAEQYMMYRKALLFSPTGDSDAVVRTILGESDPRRMRALGRKVRGFDQALWDAEKYQIVLEGNLLRFRGNPECRAKLLATGRRELVEASRYDRVWGIGFSELQAPTVDRARWGENLLGKVLMEVRDVLLEESGVE